MGLLASDLSFTNKVDTGALLDFINTQSAPIHRPIIIFRSTPILLRISACPSGLQAIFLFLISDESDNCFPPILQHTGNTLKKRFMTCTKISAGSERSIQYATPIFLNPFQAQSISVQKADKVFFLLQERYPWPH